jgi:hypothetical protein
MEGIEMERGLDIEFRWIRYLLVVRISFELWMEKEGGEALHIPC